MGKFSVFLFVVLFGVLRGLLQRRQVKRELEERLTKARSRQTIRELPETRNSEHRESNNEDQAA